MGYFDLNLNARSDPDVTDQGQVIPGIDSAKVDRKFVSVESNQRFSESECDKTIFSNFLCCLIFVFFITILYNIYYIHVFMYL